MVALSFGIDNLPYGSVIAADGRRFAAVRFEDSVLDLGAINAELFAEGTLDSFLATGPDGWDDVRGRVIETLVADRVDLVPLDTLRPVLAFSVADFVDFYASEHHATNAGRMFRPGAAPLPSHWKRVPIGYHGRSGSVVVSGTDIERPAGMVDDNTFTSTRRLDFEAEVGFVIGRPGRRITVAEADEHVFGVCLVNDWSARDVQGYETVPLGPFLGKSFATSVSAWITPMAALESARVTTVQDPVPAAHLRESDPGHGLDLQLEVSINATVVSRPVFRALYWTWAQMLAHLTSNGAPVRTGDLYASGTVSGPERGQRGCLLELGWNGTEPVELNDGSTRLWLADGDEVTIRASAGTLTLAEVSGRVVPG
ncbi:MAG: fumarylacetoacetate hydrolase family protein [Jatrophihabitans sp.]